MKKKELTDREFEAYHTILNDQELNGISQPKFYEHIDLQTLFRKARKPQIMKNLSSRYIPRLVKKGLLEQDTRPSKRGKGKINTYNLFFRSSEAESLILNEYEKRGMLWEFISAPGFWLTSFEGLADIIRGKLGLDDKTKIIVPPSAMRPYLECNLFGADSFTNNMDEVEVIKSFMLVDYTRTKNLELKKQLKKWIKYIEEQQE